MSGKSLRAFAEERIFRPLGMLDTHFHDDYTMLVKGRAAGYARAGAAWRVSLPNFDTYGATSLFSTVGDLLKWEANVAKPTVGNAALFRAMEASAVLANGDSTAYAPWCFPPAGRRSAACATPTATPSAATSC